MRTTIEITDRQRTKLLELAGRRGETGLTDLITAAIDSYISALATREAARSKALGLRGSLSDQEADEMRGAVRDLRSAWR